MSAERTRVWGNVYMTAWQRVAWTVGTAVLFYFMSGLNSRIDDNLWVRYDAVKDIEKGFKELSRQLRVLDYEVEKRERRLAFIDQDGKKLYADIVQRRQEVTPEGYAHARRERTTTLSYQQYYDMLSLAIRIRTDRLLALTAQRDELQLELEAMQTKRRTDKPRLERELKTYQATYANELRYGPEREPIRLKIKQHQSYLHWAMAISIVWLCYVCPPIPWVFSILLLWLCGSVSLRRQ